MLSFPNSCKFEKKTSALCLSFLPVHFLRRWRRQTGSSASKPNSWVRMKSEFGHIWHWKMVRKKVLPFATIFWLVLVVAQSLDLPGSFLENLVSDRWVPISPWQSGSRFIQKESRDRLTERIFRGWELSPHEFPWMVKIKVGLLCSNFPYYLL